LGFYPMITADFGAWINHSWTPNTYLKWNTESGVWDVVASQDLIRDSELTLDYRDTPFYVKKPDKNWK
jgi:SET domain-containing protein